MKAIVIHEFGPPDVLKYETVPDPEPRAGEIRIRIHAATVNRVLDVSLRAGKEAARGRLIVERIAGKDFTTLEAIANMRRLCRIEQAPCRVEPSRPASTSSCGTRPAC